MYLSVGKQKLDVCRLITAVNHVVGTGDLLVISLQTYLVERVLFNKNALLNPLLLPTDAHNVKKRRVIKTF